MRLDAPTGMTVCRLPTHRTPVLLAADRAASSISLLPLQTVAETQYVRGDRDRSPQPCATPAINTRRMELRRRMRVCSYEEATCKRSQVSQRVVEGEEDCSVCLCVFEPSDSVRLLGCTHIFHADCIDKWFACSPVCPSCKAEC